MTVDKFRFTKDDSDYTTFPNILLQGLRNAEALGLYIYLASLPPTWAFYKEKIRDHFQFGRDKLEKLLNILLSHNLIQIFQERNLKGHFNHWRLHVNNPSTFQPLTDFQETDKTPTNTAFSDLSTPLTDLPFTANQSLDNSSYKRNNTKQRSLRKKTKKLLDKNPKQKAVDNSKRHAFAESMDQMARETKQIQEHEERIQNEKHSPMPEELRLLIKRIPGKIK